MIEHSNYSPSRLSRIIKCPGSVELIDSLIIGEKIPKETVSEYAQHGTDLHKITDGFFRYGKGVLKDLIVEDKFLVTECIDYKDMLVKSKGHMNLQEVSETQISLQDWGIPDVWGTLDYQIIDPIKRHVDIIDWKFGAGIIVYAEKNPQLLAYAAGAMGWPTTIQTATLHIVQPAKEHFDTYDISVNDLYKWVHKELAVAIFKAASGFREFNPGEEQCRWCEAKNHCRARLTYAQDYAVRLFEAHKIIANVPSLEELQSLLDQAPLVEKMINDIRLYFQRELEKGNEVPGYKLVRGRSNRSWVNEKKTIEWLTEHTKIEDMFESKLRSPNQFEMEMKSLKKNDEFKALYEQVPGKIKLAPLSDKRPAESVTKSAVDVFKDYQAPDILE